MEDDTVDGLKVFDLVTLSGVLRVCDLEMVLVDKHGPLAAVDTRVHDGSQFYAIECGFRFRGRFILPLDWCLVGLIHETQSDRSWCHGTPLTTGTVFTILPEGMTEFSLAAGTKVTLMLVPLSRFMTWHSRLNLHGSNIVNSVSTLFYAGNGASGSRLQQKYEQLRWQLINQDLAEPWAGDEVDELLQAHIHALYMCTAGERPTCTRGRRVHYMILKKAEDFMRMNLRRDIYINEICDAAGVSERALRYAFDDTLGVSPNRYLSMLRLCTACRSLSMADASRRSVKSIALSCGLWDLSRFADNYRRIFGELPRDTLMRVPPAGHASH